MGFDTNILPSGNALVIPIKCDALLVLAGDPPLAEGRIDFSRLPFNNGHEDINTEFAYISENFLSQPFQNNNLFLPPGVHLHWALPDAFTRATVSGSGENGHVLHPAVPDRWVINRKRTGVVEKSWAVESNYLHPAGSDNRYHAIAHPVADPNAGQPFRYMGRSYCIYDKKKGTSIPSPPRQAGFLADLTAVGYGEHTFAAFYPNCHSVFGFHDRDVLSPEDLNQVDYEILGYYSSPFQFDPVTLAFGSNTNGSPSGSLHFDGVDDAMRIGSSESLPLDRQFTIEAWIKPEAKSDINSIVTKKYAGWETPGFAFYINSWNTSDSRLVLETLSAKAYTRNPVKNGEWQHVAVSVKDGEVSMYVNGILQEMESNSVNLKPSADLLRVGEFYPNRGNYNLKGFIHEVRIWSKARSHAQIQSQMNQRLKLPQDGLVGLYHFNHGKPAANNAAQNTVPDSSGNSRAGNLNGFRLVGSTSNWHADSPHEKIRGGIKEIFNFDLRGNEDNDPVSIPSKSVCFATLSFDSVRPPSPKSINDIAIGNTGTEALSTLLAHKLALKAGTDSRQLEARLEALQLRAKVAGKKLDIDAAFAEAYHERGFTAVDGGHIWSLHLESVVHTNEANKGKKGGAEITLPDSFAHWINDVNQLQQKHDQGVDKLASLRQTLYTDWCKYLVSAYHADIETGLPQVDDVRYFIENHSIPNIERQETEIQSIEKTIQSELTRIRQLVDVFNSGLSAHNSPGQITELFFNAPSEGSPSNTQKDPQLDGIFVKHFDGAESGEKIDLFDDPNTTFNALSFWVNISGHQPLDSNQTPYARQLLKLSGPGTPAQDRAVIDVEGFDPYWQTIYVNGVVFDPYQVVKWKDLPKDQWIHVYLRGAEPLALPQTIVLMDGLKGSLAGVRVYRAGLSAMELFCDINMLGHKALKLVSDKGPRYWQATEPVALISGEVARPTDRHGMDGALPCMLVNLDYPASLTDNPDPQFYQSSGFDRFDPRLFKKLLHAIRDFPSAIEKKINEHRPYYDEIEAAYKKTQTLSRPWNPLILEWKVGVVPLADDSGTIDYTLPEDIITSNFILADDQPDLIPHPAAEEARDQLRIFSGSTILTPHAKFRTREVIEGYLKSLHEDDPDWNNFEGAKPDPFINPYVNDEGEADASKIQAEQAKLTSPIDPSDTIGTALKAYDAVGDNTHFLSQSFGGFNAALQMLHQTFQLPIADPVGFRDDQAFAEKVKAYVQRESRWAPLPLFEFEPLRTGQLRLLELSIIDTFGQIQKVYDEADEKRIAPLYSRTLEDGQLPPRIAQPARLSLRWLSANHNDMEMNDHSLSSPVCGWLVPNNIEGSIVVYDQQGYSLGSVQQAEGAHDGFLPHWEPTPGNTATTPLPGNSSKTGGDPVLMSGNDDEYKHLTFYEAYSTGADGFDPFSVEGEFYFTYTLGGRIYLMSEGYKSARSRNNGINSVDTNRKDPTRYQTLQLPNGQFYFILKAKNNREIAQSRLFPSLDIMNGIISELQQDQPSASSAAIGVDIHANATSVDRLATVDAQFPNAHLKDVVNKILLVPSLTDFIELLEKTMDQIDPENFAQHTDLAMLMGRPIAIVRASVSLEIKGEAAINQNWEMFNSDMNALLDPVAQGPVKRTTNAWEKVRFPVRIGEHGQLNDGVLGYWPDADPATFLSSVPANDSEIAGFLGSPTLSRGYQAHRPNLTLAPESAPAGLTLLIDPRGKVHASCGALPAKTITIPDDQFKPALKNMSVTFFTRPLLMPLNQLAIPLPREPGYHWSWLEQKDSRWIEIATTGVVYREDFDNAFKNGDELWAELIHKGWIEETEHIKARVVPQNRRKDPDPRPLLITQLNRIQALLDDGHIVDENYQADFTHANRIKEGWLKLTPDE